MLKKMWRTAGRSLLYKLELCSHSVIPAGGNTGSIKRILGSELTALLQSMWAALQLIFVQDKYLVKIPLAASKKAVT